MIKNLKNVLYFFGSFSMFLSCSSEIENPNHNTKPEIAIDSINSDNEIPDGIEVD